MHNLRTFMSWMYAISSLQCLRIAFLRILRIQRDFVFLPVPLLNLLVPTEFSVFAIIFGVAWWTVFKGKPSARGWGITASLIYVLFSLSEIIYYSRPVWGSLGVMLATGVAGLVAFVWRKDRHGSSEKPRESADYRPARPNETPRPEQTTR